MSKILITGSEGFIGTHLKNILTEENEIIPFDVRLDMFQNILNEKITKEIVKKTSPDVIVHLAANPDVSKSAKYPREDLLTNTTGTINMLEAAKEVGVKLFVFSSTAQVYGEPQEEKMSEKHLLNPKSPYGIGKLAAEHYCKYYHNRFDVPTVIFRFFNIYGPNQPEDVVVPSLIKKIKKANSKLEMFGTKKDSRDFVYVEDVCNAISLAIKKKPCGETMNVGSGKETRILDLAEKLAEILGKKIEFTYGGEEEEAKISRMCSSIEKINEVLGWKQKIDLDEGLKRVVESIK